MDFRELISVVVVGLDTGVVELSPPPPPPAPQRVSMREWFDPPRRPPAPPEANDER
jgi:hypothetical protein